MSKRGNCAKIGDTGEQGRRHPQECPRANLPTCRVLMARLEWDQLHEGSV